jgi:hypothetical protein
MLLLEELARAWSGSSETMASSRPPAFLLALGREPLPERVHVAGDDYVLRQTFKHDFFAATARYEGDRGQIVVKFGRRASFFGLPLNWIGRWHVAHETAAYAALADLPVVPRLVGRLGRDAFAHVFVEGHPLHKGEQVPDDFFPRLREGLEAIHAREMAYVDLEKCENVLVGDDGRPYLFDFQIAWRWPWRRGGNWVPFCWICRHLQRADFYHLGKLQRRTRPDQMSAEALEASYRKPWYVRLHNRLTRPFTLVRRWFLQRIDPRCGKGERGRVEG